MRMAHLGDCYLMFCFTTKTPFQNNVVSLTVHFRRSEYFTAVFVDLMMRAHEQLMLSTDKFPKKKKTNKHKQEREF